MKKILLCLSLLFYIGLTNVKAKEVYYTNSKNVCFSKEEYDFITNILWDGYQESMSLIEYNSILKNGVTDDVQSEELDIIMPLGTSHSTANKTLVITKAKSGNTTTVSVKATWTNLPVVRSYDVIGAYIMGPSIPNDVFTKVFTSSTTGTVSSNIKYNGNGFGVSIKLPTSGNSIVISQVYSVTGTGTINASYQHATTELSLSDSQKYTISGSGAGGVFAFDSSVYNYYDHMRGVDISI